MYHLSSATTDEMRDSKVQHKEGFLHLKICLWGYVFSAKVAYVKVI